MLLESLCWLLPPTRIKNWLLRRFGHQVALTASIAPSIVIGVKKFEIGEHARIGFLNVIRHLSYIRLDDYAAIDTWNWISAHPVYQEIDPNAGTLYLGVCARVGSRSYLDCSGTIAIHHYTYVGGHYCLLQTHQPDYERARQTVGRITVGHHSFVASRAVMLKGAYLPERSLLAANSTLTRNSATENKPGLYAGSPAVWKRPAEGAWFTRNTYTMAENVVEEPMGLLADDLNEATASLPVDVAETPQRDRTSGAMCDDDWQLDASSKFAKGS
jgi:acetyltransferase-like isoleucine patch superfamily enzyme